MATITLLDECQPEIGRWVKPDGWNIGANLEESTWEPAAFRMMTNNGGPITSLAVNIAVTGRTIQQHNGAPAVRVRIEFVGDGEPSTYTSGWMIVRRS